MSPFLIVAAVFILLNIIFMLGSLLYVLLGKENKKEEIQNEEEVEMRNPIRISNFSGSASGQDPRISRSSLPQVMVYRAIVRLSQSSAPNPPPQPKPSFWRRLGRKNGNYEASSHSMPPMR